MLERARLEEMTATPFSALPDGYFSEKQKIIYPKQDLIAEMMRLTPEEITAVVRGQLRYGRDNLVELQQALIKLPDTKENRKQCQNALEAVRKTIDEANAIEALVAENQQLFPALETALNEANITPENITRIMQKANLLLKAQRDIFYNPTAGAHVRFHKQIEEFNKTVSRATIRNHKGRIACLLFTGLLVGLMVGLAALPFGILAGVILAAGGVAISAAAGTNLAVGLVILATIGGVINKSITINRSANRYEFFPTPPSVLSNFSQPLESKLNAWAHADPARHVIFN